MEIAGIDTEAEYDTKIHFAEQVYRSCPDKTFASSLSPFAKLFELLKLFCQLLGHDKKYVSQAKHEKKEQEGASVLNSVTRTVSYIIGLSAVRTTLESEYFCIYFFRRYHVVGHKLE